MKYYLKDKRVIIGISVFLVLCGLFLIIYFFKGSESDMEFQSELTVETKEEKENVESNFYIDVKGAVKDPGVYLVSEGERVIDAIEKAGGLKKNANTSNINLSKRLSSEMVVVVYTNNEIKKGKNSLECNTECNCEVIEINNCIEREESKENTNLININTASTEELMNITGIGESKAKSIIQYREENGNFKVIEDIKNVSGIGDALFEKIKGSITV